jgi:AMP-binding enzyme
MFSNSSKAAYPVITDGMPQTPPSSTTSPYALASPRPPAAPVPPAIPPAAIPCTMLRAGARHIARAMRTPSSRAVRHPRWFASAARQAGAGWGLSVLAAAAAANPLKDAAKFYRSAVSAEDEAAAPADAGLPTKGVDLWTYRDLAAHARALAVGLCEAGLVAGDRLVVALPPESQEYLTLLLAAADCGVTVVAVGPPAKGAAVDVGVVRAALEKYQPRALIVWHAYYAADGGGGSVLDALFPGAVATDAAGVEGMVPITGRPAASEEHPYLQYVVHTSDAHVRGAMSFKSLLVYSDAQPASRGLPSSVVLVEAATGRELTQSALLAEAKTTGAKLKLVSDVYSKNGKLLLRPEASVEAAATAVSALMHGTLLITSDAGQQANAAEIEQSLVC